MEFERSGRGGRRLSGKDKKSGAVYTEGPFKGMTQGQADNRQRPLLRKKWNSMTSEQQDQYRDVTAADMEADRQASIQSDRDAAMVAREADTQKRQDEERFRMEADKRNREEAKKNAATEYVPKTGQGSGNVVENKKAPVTNPSSPPAETTSAKVSPVKRAGTISGIPANEYLSGGIAGREKADQSSPMAKKRAEALDANREKMAENAKKKKEEENA